MPESVYDLILPVGSSKESWEKAAANAVEQASKSLHIAGRRLNLTIYSAP
jgi:flavin-binding protein dodecin